MIRNRLKWLFEVLAQALILFGLFGMCQPWWMALYRRGFLLILIGTALFIVVTHIPAVSTEGEAQIGAG